MQSDKQRIKVPVLAPLILAVLILLGSSILGAYWLQHHNYIDNIHMKVEETKLLYDKNLRDDARLMNSLLDFIERKEDFQQAWLEQNRDRLLELAAPIFEDVRSKYKVTHFYFIGLDKKCFLRVHAPTRYGDLITRFTLEAAAYQKKPVYGVELGPYGTFALRTVHPWLIDGQLAGYVELGEEIGHILPALKDTFNVESFVVINKKYVNRADWEEGMRILGHKDANWDFLSKAVIVESTFVKLSQKSLQNVKGALEHSNRSLFSTTIEGHRYRGGFVPLLDTGGRHVGDIVVIIETTKMEAALTLFSVMLASICVIVGVILCVLFYVYIRRIESRLTNVYTSLQDEIEKRRQVEEKIQQQNDFFATVIESLMHPFYVIDADDYTIKIANSAARQGDMPEKATCYQITHKRSKPCDEFDELYPLKEVKRTKKPVTMEYVHYDKADNPQYVEVHAFPVFDGEGNVSEIIKYCFDITERKRAEETLRESEEWYKSLFKANIDGILIADVTTKKFRYANPAICRILGYSEEELMRMGLADIHPKESLEQVFAEFEAQASGARINADLPCVRKDGQVISVSINAGTVTIGQTEYLMGIFRDITERKQAEQELQRLNAELEEANQELKNFVYIASHDIREPLRKVTAFGAILEKSLKDKVSDDDRENLHFMIDGAGRMTKMIEGLLTYSKISTQAQPHQAVDLNEIVKQLQQFELAVLLEEKQVTIEAQSLLTVEAEPVQIRQLMQNLIANGIKYQKKGNIPYITITTKPAADGMVRIEVTDNGIGIVPEYQQSIFVMFKRLHSRSEYEGTGIGLAVCKKIVERHGGKVGVESEPDKGSTFWFTIPVAEKTAVAVTEVKSNG